MAWSMPARMTGATHPCVRPHTAITTHISIATLAISVYRDYILHIPFLGHRGGGEEDHLHYLSQGQPHLLPGQACCNIAPKHYSVVEVHQGREPVETTLPQRKGCTAAAQKCKRSMEQGLLLTYRSVRIATLLRPVVSREHHRHMW
jgi:hypothetical protein